MVVEAGPSHSKPEPESSKQSIKLTADQEMVQIPNTANSNNSVTSNADATIGMLSLNRPYLIPRSNILFFLV